MSSNVSRRRPRQAALAQGSRRRAEQVAKANMRPEQETFRAVRDFPWKGSIVPQGKTVKLFPRQAKYFIGTYLERAGKGAPAGDDDGSKGGKN